MATTESLNRLISSVARQVSNPSDAIWRSGIIDEEAALADKLQNARDLIFGNDRGPDAERETAILLGLIDLRDLAMASDVMAPFVSAGHVARGNAEVAGRILQGIADALLEIAGQLRVRPRDEAPNHDRVRRVQRRGRRRTKRGERECR